MLAKVLLQLYNRFLLYRDWISFIMTLAAPLSLSIGVGRYNIDSSEMYHNDLNTRYKLLRDTPMEFTMRSPHETICIVLPEADEDAQLLKEVLTRINIRPKSIIMSQENSVDNYFLKLRITMGKKECVYINPLRNIQPNLDMLSLAVLHHFPPKINFFRTTEFTHVAYENTINVCIERTPASFLKLLEFLKVCMYVEKFGCASHYYTPFVGWLMKGESLFLFGMIVIGIECFGSKGTADPLKLACYMLATYFIPPACLAALSMEPYPIFAFAALSINLKFGFILSVCKYLQILVRMFCRKTMQRRKCSLNAPVPL